MTRVTGAAATFTELAVDLDARVTLRVFAELDWEPLVADEVPARGSIMGSSASGRYSWLRKARSRGRPLPEPVGGSSRASLYRLGDLVSWVEDTAGPGGARHRVVFDPRWVLGVDASSYVDEQHSMTGRSSNPSSDDTDLTPLDDLRHFLMGAVLLFDGDDRTPRLAVDVEAELLVPSCEDLPTRLHALAGQRGGDSGLIAAGLLGCGARKSVAAGRAARAAAALYLSGMPPSELADLLFERFTGLEVRAGRKTTGGSLARLLVGLGAPRPGETVVDPACGEGQLLLAAARRQPAAFFVGRDHDAVSVLAARAVLALNAIPADFGDGSTDSLADGAGIPRGDLVLLDPPLSAGHMVRWLKLAARLAPRGRAVVVLPGVSLQPGRREWSALSDHVAAVVACPARLRSDTGEAPAIWVLDTKAGSDEVLVVDATALGAGGFGPDDADALAAGINGWCADRRIQLPDGVRARSLSRRIISDAGGELRLASLEECVPQRGHVADAADAAGQSLPGDRSADEDNNPTTLARQLLDALDRTASPAADELRRVLRRFLEDPHPPSVDEGIGR